MLDFIETVQQLVKHFEDTEQWEIKGLRVAPDLSGFSKQDTDMTIFPTEFIKQYGYDDAYYGDIYFPMEGESYLLVSYYE